MKAHIGADAGTGYVHSVTVTGANVHDLDEAAAPVRGDDEVVYTDAGYQGVQRRPEVAGDGHLSTLELRVAARKGALQAMPDPDRAAESREASVRAEVEHPFLIVKARLRLRQDPLPGAGQEPQPPARAVRLRELAHAGEGRRPDRVTAGRQPARNPPGAPERG